MRVPTHQTSKSAFDGIEARQAEQSRLQTQLATGLRINSPGDDPVAAAQAELARSRLTRLAQDQRSTQLATGLLSAADTALAEGVNLLQSVRESLVAAGNGSYNASDRQALALQLRSARERMLALANTRDGAGGFVFAGQGSSDAPMGGGGAPAYSAAAGVQRIGEQGRYAATVDGRASFISLPQGNGVFVTASAGANSGAGWIDPGSVSNPSQLTGHNYRITISGAPGALVYGVANLTLGTTLASGALLQDGGTIDIDGQRVKVSGNPAPGDAFNIAPAGQQSVFKTLDDAIATLEQPTTTPVYAEKLERTQASLDRVLDGMILMRSRVGEELRNVEDAGASGAKQELVSQQRRSELQDLDYARAISEFHTNQTSLEAALKLYAGVARTSLFQLLG